MKLVGDSKEKIIQKLQTDFEIMENEYNTNLFSSKKIGDDLKMNDMTKSQYINELINQQKMLAKENRDLKSNINSWQWYFWDCILTILFC